MLWSALSNRELKLLRCWPKSQKTRQKGEPSEGEYKQPHFPAARSRSSDGLAHHLYEVLVLCVCVLCHVLAYLNMPRFMSACVYVCTADMPLALTVQMVNSFRKWPYVLFLFPHFLSEYVCGGEEKEGGWLRAAWRV